MAIIIRTKNKWDYWAPKYDRIWGIQKFSLRPTRRFVHRYINELKIPPENILDIGCGIGELSYEIASNHPDINILAVDYSPGMISRAMKDFCAPNIKHIHGSLEDVPANSKFDLIISTHSFPYFPDKLEAAKKMKDLLAPKGKLIIVQGNTNNFYDLIWLAIVKFGVSKAQFLAVKKVKNILECAGFAITKTASVDRAFWMPSIYLVEGVNN